MRPLRWLKTVSSCRRRRRKRPFGRSAAMRVGDRPSVRRAMSACRSSTILPLSWITPLPAFSGRSKASMIARGVRDLRRRRRELLVADVDLARVDQRLAVEADVAALLALGPEAVEILDVVVDAVDDVAAVGARRDDAVGEPGDHGRPARGEPRARLLGEIVEPHHQHFEPRGGIGRDRGDRAGVEDRLRRLHHRPKPGPLRRARSRASPAPRA